MPKIQLVSVVIPAKNSEATIKKCLQSIIRQTYRNIEIIVVDDFSEDNTKTIIASFPDVKLIEQKSTTSQARNIGVKNAKGEFIIIIDTDQVLSQNVISECVLLADKGVDLISIPEFGVSANLWSRFAEYDRQIGFDKTNRDIPRFFRKQVFYKTGNFNENLWFGEDWDFARRAELAGFRKGIISGAKILHYEATTLSGTIRKYYKYGKTMRKLFYMHSLSARKMYINSAIFNKNMIKYFIRNPFLFSGAMLFKSIRYISAALGYAMVRKWQR